MEPECVEGPVRRAYRARALERCLRPGRFILNYKKLPYRTVWIEFPDIEPISHELGVAPTSKWPDGSGKYTVPLIFDPNTRTAVAESIVIARYIDDTYPDTPRVIPEGTAALQKCVAEFVWRTINLPLARNSRMEQLKFNPASVEYVQGVFRRRWGKKPEDLYSEDNWVEIEQGFDALAGFLDFNGVGKEGSFAGEKLCFADFEVAGHLQWIRTVSGENSEEWRRVCSWNGGRWRRFLDQFEPYMAVD